MLHFQLFVLLLKRVPQHLLLHLVRFSELQQSKYREDKTVSINYSFNRDVLF